MIYPTKKISEVCEIQRGWSPRPIKDFITDDENWINWIKIWDTKKVNKFIYKTNEKIKPEWVKRSRMVYPWDFILSNSMSFWKPYIMKTTWCIHDWWLVLRTDKNIIDDNFLYLLLSSDIMYSKFSKATSWTTVQNLSIDKVKDIKIPLPPIQTQKLIVQKLDSSFKNIDESIKNTKNNIENIEELNNSVLEKVFKESEYIEKSIDEISEKVQYGYTWKTIDKWKVKYLRITDIQNNNIIWNNVPYVEIEDKEISKYSLNEWDIVFARTWATVWKSCLIDKKWIWNIFASYLIRIVWNKELLNPNYMQYFFYSIYYWEQIWFDVVWAAQPNFNWTKLKQIKIPLPPLSKQKEIVLYLDKVFEKNKQIKESYEKKLKELEEMKQSILKEAFEWRLIKN